MITLDTSGVYALSDRRDAHHGRAAQVLKSDRGPYLVPAATLGELGYLLETRLGFDATIGFLRDLASGDFSLDCGERDFERIQELITRYKDLPLGLTDAAVIACAERNGGAVLTTDARHFGIVAREGTIRLLPAI
ncbi:MAG: type II toxin-antitoxin system VapC family toxin [bacterium]